MHAARPGGPAGADRAALADQRRLIESADGTYHQVTGDDIPAALLMFARAANATQLVLGATRQTRLAALRPAAAIRSRVICGASGIDVHIVTCIPTADGVRPAAGEPDKRRRTVMTQQNTSRPGPVRLAARWGRRREASGRGRHPWRMGLLAPAAVVAAALTVAACSSSGSGGAAGAAPTAASGSAASGSALKTTTIGGTTVLTNAKGFTLYMFAPDSATASKCKGSCAQVWPPVKGPVTGTSGVTGTLGTITRAGGSTQATYNGRPLYTYVGDTQPGQAKGNGLNGVWHEVTASGSAVPAASSGAGGYGY